MKIESKTWDLYLYNNKNNEEIELTLIDYKDFMNLYGYDYLIDNLNFFPELIEFKILEVSEETN